MDSHPVASTRRGFLRSAGLAGLGAGTAGAVAGPVSAAASTAGTPGVVSFYGAHQAGIATPAQNYLQFASLDVVTASLAGLRTLLRTWSDAAARMALGERVGPIATGSKPPADTGEAIGLGPSQLTVTFGFGPALFSKNGADRFGLASRRPAPLVDLPAFATDRLQEPVSGGDLGVQVCANDPQVAFHAAHDLIALARPFARPRWLIAGFGHTRNSRYETLGRNLMGFHDGTANVMAEDAGGLDRFVWAGKPASPAWMRGGSYLVARRIEIALGGWDTTGLTAQERTIGRAKLSGTVLAAMPGTAHVLQASPELNGGARIMRRGYSYVDGVDPASGDPATGLMFLCFQADPRHQFIPIQRRLAANDALNAFTRHIGSAIFACPPGAAPGGFVGEGLVG